VRLVFNFLGHIGDL